MAVISSDLSARFAAGQIDALRGRFGRALEDNPAGNAVLASALQRAVDFGYTAWVEIEGPPADEICADDGWTVWQAQRQLTPEAQAWPERLAGAGAVGERALAQAERAFLEAGAELGLASSRRARTALAELGAQAAEAGAALHCALDGATPEPATVEAIASPDLGVPALEGTVRIVSVTSRPECEMLQGMLANAGIPSFWRQSAGEPRYATTFGTWDVYVPVASADEARVVLSTPIAR